MEERSLQSAIIGSSTELTVRCDDGLGWPQRAQNRREITVPIIAMRLLEKLGGAFND